MYKAVIFDFDGTLALSLDSWVLSYQHALATQGVEATEADVISKCFFRSYEEAAGNFQVDSVQFFNDIQDELHRQHQVLELTEGAKDAVEYCRSLGLKTAIVTSSQRTALEIGLRQTGLDGLIDIIVTGNDVERLKPYPDPILKALELLGVTSGEALYLGDYVVDITAGKAAGVHTALFYPAHHDKFFALEDLVKHEPHHVFRTFPAIVDHVRSAVSSSSGQ